VRQDEQICKTQFPVLFLKKFIRKFSWSVSIAFLENTHPSEVVVDCRVLFPA
jgi:hypothetical protein